MKKIDEYEIGKEYLIGSPGLWVHYCCGCGLRHNFFVEIVNDKKNDYIRLLAYPEEKRK